MARLNHLAIVVEDIQAALAFWHDALGLPLGSTERNEREEVDIAFLPLDVGQIELLAPINDSSGVGRYLASHGGGMHHVGLEVEDIAATMQRLTARATAQNIASYTPGAHSGSWSSYMKRLTRYN